MANTIPDLFSRPGLHFASYVRLLTEEFPITKRESIVMVNIIGQGSFGQVSLVRKNDELLVLKEMLDKSETCQRLFLKEVKILNMLKHKNIVRFHSLCQYKEPLKSFLLEYVQFVFPFGYNESVSSLQDFLSYINEFNCVKFEHLQNFIARDICAGLAYLHERDIAHRDLKPGNVLVSNQHYFSLSGQEIEIMWRTQPVIAKLTDFGESMAALVQTNNILHTHTMNIFRGTILYMAPEILKSSSSASINMIGLEELKNMDIWSYAMVLFMLLNPDLRHPYELELQGCAFNGMVPMTLLRLFDMQMLPCNSTMYDSQRKSNWGNVFEAFRFCAKFTSRPTAREALSLIESLLDRKSNTMPLEGVIPKWNSCNAEPSAVVSTVRSIHYSRIEQIYATIYGQCIGEENSCMYWSNTGVSDDRGQKTYLRREGWEVGEFILLMQSLIDNNGVVDPQDFARRLVKWMKEGFPEFGGIAIDNTTCNTITWKGSDHYLATPHKISQDVWEESGRLLADNGGVMRTSILGTLAFRHIDQVYRNAIDICKTTHFDPRCQASTVSVCIGISLMLRRQYPHYENGEYIIQKIIEDVFHEASTCLETEEEKEELWECLNCIDLCHLHLDLSKYNTYKCLGAGFWALKQNDFEKALQKISEKGGDSTANCAVAGALLGCKLGSRKCFPESWLNLRYRDWLDMLIQRYLKVLNTLRLNEII